MKKKNIEYEGAEEVVTKIKCNGCEERWDSRGGENSTVVVLNVQLREKSISRWRNTDFDSMIHRDTAYEIISEDVADFCESCWSEKRLGPAMKVEDVKHHVEEKEVIEYHCDFCDENMGQSSDNEVTVNPRIIEFERVCGNMSTDRRNVQQHGMDGRIHTSHRGERKYDTEHDGQYDCCEECANEIFEQPQEDRSSDGALLAFCKFLKPF